MVRQSPALASHMRPLAQVNSANAQYRSDLAGSAWRHLPCGRVLHASSFWQSNEETAQPEETTSDAIMAAVHQITHTIHARAVVCWTKSGSTGLL